MSRACFQGMPYLARSVLPRPWARSPQRRRSRESPCADRESGPALLDRLGPESLTKRVFRAPQFFREGFGHCPRVLGITLARDRLNRTEPRVECLHAIAGGDPCHGMGFCFHGTDVLIIQRLTQDWQSLLQFGKAGFEKREKRA